MKKNIQVLSTILVLVWIVGCTSVPEVIVPYAQAEDGQVPATTGVTTLDPELLYSVLVGEIAGQRGDLNLAAKEYWYAAQTSHNVEIAERATRISMYAKNWELTEKSARLWLKLSQNAIKAHQALALSFFYRQKLDATVREFKNLVNRFERGKEQGLLLVAKLLEKEPAHDFTLQVLQQLINAYPDYAQAWYAYAILALKAKAFPQAERAIEQAIQRQPEWDKAIILHAHILLSQEKSEAAISVLKQGLESKDNYDLRFSLAKALFELKRYDESIEQFKKLLANKKHKKSEDVIYALALLSLQTNRYDQSKYYLIQLLNSDEYKNEASYYLGQLEETQKHYLTALQWYSQVKGGSYQLESQIRVVTIVAKLGDLEKSRQLLHDLRAKFPQFQVRFYLVEGDLLSTAEQFEQALALYNKALMEFKDNADLLYARALVYDDLGNLAQFEKDLRTILATDPLNVDALNALGYTLAEKTQRYDEALTLIKQALALKPDSAAIIDSMGWVNYKLKNYELAVKYLKKAYALDKNDEIAAHLGQALWAMGEQQKAKEIWGESLQLHPDSKYLQKFIDKMQSIAK